MVVTIVLATTYDIMGRSTRRHTKEEAMILYCRRCIIEDFIIARETSRLCGEMVAIVDEKEQFLQELDALPRRLVLEKMAELLRETQNKYMQRMLQLQVL
nr:hypothetical protein [Tanacetum cinerariifolium]